MMGHEGTVKGTQGNDGEQQGNEDQQSHVTGTLTCSLVQVADGHGPCIMHSPYKAQCLIETQHLDNIQYNY
jgi:hypothetical protein